MKIKKGNTTVQVNTMSNWPMLVDLFVKWGFSEEILDEAKENDKVSLTMVDLDKATSELSAWGIPWKKEF